MERKICPYLGRPDDAATYMSFPSEGNFCHKARPAAPPHSGHQSEFCLSGKHEICPVFLMHRAQPLPALLAAPPPERAAPWVKLRNSALLAAALLVYLASTWFGGTHFAARFMALAGTEATADLAANPFLLEAQPPSSELLYKNPNADAVAEAEQECPAPEGWVAYTVQPTDSLFRLGIVYGASIEALQQANCMGSQTYLAPGRVLYVPAPKPTTLPSATGVPTQQTPTATFAANAGLSNVGVFPATPIPQQPNPPAPQIDEPTRPRPTDPPPVAEPAKPKPTKEEKPTNVPPPEEKKDNNKGKDKGGDDDDKKDSNKGKGKGGGDDDDDDDDDDKDDDKGKEKGKGKNKGKGGGKDK